MSRLDEIPTAFEPPVDARPSAVVARIRAIRPSRRTVLRGLVIGAAAAALVPLDWYLARREAAAAEPRTDGDDKSEHMDCAPASYREEANNWPSTGPAVCYGGFRRGGFPCSDGYHREGSYNDGPDAFESTRVTQSCNGRNAWRWNGYRCSDAITNVVFADGTEYRGISIAACTVPGGATTDPEPEPERETTSPSPSNDREQSGSGDSGSDSPGRGGGDPSRPRRLLPVLGANLRSIPVLGSLLGS
ncbi:MAG: hypothetical protein L0I24_12430 [Pseudonocardia sp.]|nr:hypothetical protein [Pseudonocardia sp.]